MIGWSAVNSITGAQVLSELCLFPAGWKPHHRGLHGGDLVSRILRGPLVREILHDLHLPRWLRSTTLYNNHA
jgi:hypothetical protein